MTSHCSWNRAVAPCGIRRPSLARALALAATVLVVSAAHAHGACGDDVDGRRVPCVCGDIVASDLRLMPDDPVLAKPCVGDGLVVRPPIDGRSLVIDLNGQEIAGSGVGAGVRVLPGGAGAIEIRGGIGDMRGTLRGFREGIRAMADGALARIVNVTVRDSIGTGVRVRGSDASLEGVRVEDNGGDGVRTSGRSVDLHDIEAQGNGRRGVEQRTSGAAERVESRANALADRLDGGGRAPKRAVREDLSR